VLKLDLRKYSTGKLLPDMGKGTYVLLLFWNRTKISWWAGEGVLL